MVVQLGSNFDSVVEKRVMGLEVGPKTETSNPELVNRNRRTGLVGRNMYVNAAWQVGSAGGFGRWVRVYHELKIGRAS